MKLSSIVAMTQNRVIGKNNAMPWHVPEDLKRFKALTMGKPMIMGRKCFESLPGILPGRPHIVVSRTSPRNTTTNNKVHYVKSIREGINLGKGMARESGADEVFIIGGGEIYAQTMGMIDRLYLTLLHEEYEGDTFFPAFDWAAWKVLLEQKEEQYSFFILQKSTH